MQRPPLIIVRGAGDLATGTICRLHSCGFRVLALEVPAPQAIRRSVSLSEAVYDGKTCVEGITASRVDSPGSCEKIWEIRQVPILVDPHCTCLNHWSPLAVVDAILAKENRGMRRDMARITIGLGPGFVAGEDVDAVVETQRGHDLGRVITRGSALPNSGIPGERYGFSWQRVVHAPVAGTLQIKRNIGTLVEKGEVVAHIDSQKVKAPLSGLVRGMIRDGFQVHKGMKIVDIDPRSDQVTLCQTISEKARCISGGVLEAIVGMYLPWREEGRR